MNESQLRDLNLSTDEITKFSNAFADPTFKDLLSQYLHEINDPDNQKVFQNELIQLEAERGNDILFIKPTPGYLLKTSVDGSYKGYINICSSDNINKLNFKSGRRNNVNGINVLVPHSVSPLQKGQDKQNVLFFVYTVVFHPDTLEQAGNNVEIKNVVEETALSAIEKSFKVKLDKTNYKTSKKPYKGNIQLTFIRKQVERTNSDYNELSVFDINVGDEYIEPTHRIKYCNDVNLQNSMMDKFCKMDILIPKQILIEIDLPLLKSTENTILDVQPTAVSLINENPKYKLHIPLPYTIERDIGNAVFDSDCRVLKLELHVQKKILQFNGCKNSEKFIAEVSDCKGIKTEDDFVPEFELQSVSTDCPVSSSYNCCETVSESMNTSFLSADIKYKLPSYFCNYYQNQIAFTLNIRNVDYGSFDYRILENKNGFWIKFTSLGTGHYPMYYAMCVVFHQNVLNAINSLEYSMESSNVFVYAYLRSNVIPLEYFVGTDMTDLKKEYLNEPDAVYLEIEDKKAAILDVDLSVSKFNSEEVVIDVVAHKDYSTTADNSSVLQLVYENGIQPVNEIDEDVQSNYGEENENSLHQNQIVKSTTGSPLKNEEEQDFAQTIDFTTFCDDFKTQFSFDDEPCCMSETELLRVSCTTAKKKNKESHSDNENRSWIVETKSAKKAKRKKKARDKKLATSNEENEGETTESTRAHSEAVQRTKPIDIRSAYKFSDMSTRSILKNKNRSFSESSGDELCHVECSQSFSIDDVNLSSDSCSQSAPKKTVRFNDVISKKLYSSDISIMEQRKRTKRRCRRKERKSSDSENSETETASSIQLKRDNIRIYNENLLFENSEIELTSLSESGGETSDDQSDNPDADLKIQPVPCSKKNHKRRGKKSARKNASTAKHHIHGDD